MYSIFIDFLKKPTVMTLFLSSLRVDKPGCYDTCPIFYQFKIRSKLNLTGVTYLFHRQLIKKQLF